MCFIVNANINTVKAPIFTADYGRPPAAGSHLVTVKAPGRTGTGHATITRARSAIAVPCAVGPAVAQCQEFKGLVLA